MNVPVTNSAGQPTTLSVPLAAGDERVAGATCGSSGGNAPTATGGTPIGAVYVDPSGTVEAAATDGSAAAVTGVTVTLSRQDPSTLSYAPAPLGSAIMSLANRTSPQTTAADGAFGWDTVAGTYQIAAQNSGCTTSTASSLVETVPPPATGLVLTLDCLGLTRARSPTSPTVPALNSAPSGP